MRDSGSDGARGAREAAGERSIARRSPAERLSVTLLSLRTLDASAAALEERVAELAALAERLVAARHADAAEGERLGRALTAARADIARALDVARDALEARTAELDHLVHELGARGEVIAALSADREGARAELAEVAADRDDLQARLAALRPTLAVPPPAREAEPAGEPPEPPHDLPAPAPAAPAASAPAAATAPGDAALEPPGTADEPAAVRVPAGDHPAGRDEPPRRSRRGLVLAGVGALVVAEVATTLAWREPISGVLDGGDSPAAATAPQTPATATPPTTTTPAVPTSTTPTPAARAKATRHDVPTAATSAAAVALDRRTAAGGALGTLRIGALGLRVPLVQGSDVASLRKGAGHYSGTGLPGGRGTAAFAEGEQDGRPVFRRIGSLRPGARIVVTTGYGRFTYRVERHTTVSSTAIAVLRDVGRPRLTLVAAPANDAATRRLVVFARLAAVAPKG